MKALLVIWCLFAFISCEYYGIDVSEFQSYIDWSAVATEKHFAIIRGGYGTDYIDPFWEYNYQNAKAAGVKVGAYWYAYAYNTAQAQAEANTFLSVLAGKQFEYPVYYDIEEQGQFDYRVTDEIATAFCSVLESNGYFCGIYSSASPLSSVFGSDVTSRYSVWVAHYFVDSPAFYGDYGIWQYSDAGSVSGIGSNVDLDVSYYDFESIIKNAGLNGFGSGGSSGGYTPPPTPTYNYYTVQPGDCLSVIAERLGVTVLYLVNINGIANPNFITVGQVLKY